jgi:hypothetical protein
MTSLNDFQQQLLLHPDVTYMGSTPSNGTADYNSFVIKSTWSHFALRNDAFGGMQRGRSITNIHPGIANVDNGAWVWPWDIVYFLRDIPSGFLSILVNVPKAVYDFWTQVTSGVAGKEIRQEDAQAIVRNDDYTWRRLYEALGTNEEFNELRPETAKWCRVIAGIERPSANARAIDEAPLNDDPRILKLVSTIATGLGIITAATLGVIGLIVTIVGTAAGLAALSGGTLAPALLVIGIVLIVLAAIGWVISVALSIVYMVVEGLLIFSGSRVQTQPMVFGFDSPRSVTPVLSMS